MSAKQQSVCKDFNWWDLPCVPFQAKRDYLLYPNSIDWSLYRQYSHWCYPGQFYHQFVIEMFSPLMFLLQFDMKVSLFFLLLLCSTHKHIFASTWHNRICFFYWFAQLNTLSLPVLSVTLLWFVQCVQQPSTDCFGWFSFSVWCVLHLATL